MNHKRGKPKSSRAGCLMCKPHKHQAFKKMSSSRTITQKRADDNMQDQLSQRTYSGQFRVRLPKSLHRNLVLRAEREGVSLNTEIVNLLSK